jgi:hypothetical protein
MRRAPGIAALLLMMAWPLSGQTQTQPQEATAAAPTKLLVEIYRIAPGQHLAFLEAIASYDQANKLAGLPPRQLFVHRDGASWDFMLIQPADIPDDKSEALGKAWEKLGLPSGADFFLDFRRFISSHEDTFVTGPTTAADYLSTRKKK